MTGQADKATLVEPSTVVLVGLELEPALLAYLPRSSQCLEELVFLSFNIGCIEERNEDEDACVG